MKFAQVPATLLTLRQQAVNVGRVALATVACARVRLARHRLRVAGKTDRYLRRIPGKVGQVERLRDKLDHFATQRRALANRTVRPVRQHVDPREPGIGIAIPQGVPRIGKCRARGVQGAVPPGQDLRI